MASIQIYLQSKLVMLIQRQTNLYLKKVIKLKNLADIIISNHT